LFFKFFCNLIDVAFDDFPDAVIVFELLFDVDVFVFGHESESADWFEQAQPLDLLHLLLEFVVQLEQRHHGLALEVDFLGLQLLQHDLDHHLLLLEQTVAHPVQLLVHAVDLVVDLVGLLAVDSQLLVLRHHHTLQLRLRHDHLGFHPDCQMSIFFFD